MFERLREVAHDGGVRKQRLFGYWYLCIAVGFLLLAVHRAVLGVRTSAVVVRLVIAIGFALLAWLQFRKPNGPGR